VQELQKILHKAILVDAYSVNKEQQVFVFDTAKGLVYLMLYTSGFNAFFWLQFSYGKPRSKYTTKFKTLYDKELSKIVCFEKERSLVLCFGNECIFLALYGRQNHVFKAAAQKGETWQIELPNHIEKEFKIAKELCADIDFVQQVLGKNITENEVQAKQKAIVNGEFCLCRNNKNEIVFSFGSTACEYSFVDIVEALQLYSKIWFREFQFKHSHERILKQLTKDKKKLENAMQAAEEQLIRIDNDLNFRLWADVIMANLHQLSGKDENLELPDFSGTNILQIPMKRNLKPQENASRYYRKAKNQGKEKEQLEERITLYFERLEQIELQLAQIEDITDIKALQTLEKQVFPEEKKSGEKVLNFIEFNVFGFNIYVGRNSKNNDELTLGFANKNDLWLHAKDLSGSHVIIRNKGSETKYPKDVIEIAAEIAAYYSKGRNQEFCPVIFTPKKYIRKGKGLPAGAVFVEREEVLLVRPGLPK